jgi:hypothetical protein
LIEVNCLLRLPRLLFEHAPAEMTSRIATLQRRECRCHTNGCLT